MPQLHLPLVLLFLCLLLTVLPQNVFYKRDCPQPHVQSSCGGCLGGYIRQIKAAETHLALTSARTCGLIQGNDGGNFIRAQHCLAPTKLRPFHQYPVALLVYFL